MMNSLFNKVADLRPVRLTSFWLFFSFFDKLSTFFPSEIGIYCFQVAFNHFIKAGLFHYD